MKKEFVNPGGVHEPRGYSHSVRVGDTIYVAGQVGWDLEGKVAAGGFEAQAEQSFKNLKAVLEGHGASLKDIVKTTIFLKDINDLAKYREVRSRYLNLPFPASTLVQIASLALPELLVEIEAVAVTDKSQE